MSHRERVRQVEFGFANWGGKRKGAGRKPKGEKAGVSHAKRPALVARFPVHVTLKLVQGLPSLRQNGALPNRGRASSVARGPGCSGSAGGGTDSWVGASEKRARPEERVLSGAHETSVGCYRQSM